jgi:glycosyltransferase involved in cell wall biosynthesis
VGHRADASELLSAVDLVWNGSLYEGQSNTIMEAMAAGVPVLATDIPGNRDLVVHRQTGYLYPLGDVNQLIRWSAELLQNPQLRSSMGRHSVQRVEQHFSLERMVSAYSELYQRLAAGS